MKTSKQNKQHRVKWHWSIGACLNCSGNFGTESWWSRRKFPRVRSRLRIGEAPAHWEVFQLTGHKKGWSSIQRTNFRKKPNWKYHFEKKIRQKSWSRLFQRIFSLKIGEIRTSNWPFGVFDHLRSHPREKTGGCSKYQSSKSLATSIWTLREELKSTVSEVDEMAHRDMSLLKTIMLLPAHQHSKFYVEINFLIFRSK